MNDKMKKCYKCNDKFSYSGKLAASIIPAAMYMVKQWLGLNVPLLALSCSMALFDVADQYNTRM